MQPPSGQLKQVDNSEDAKFIKAIFRAVLRRMDSIQKRVHLTSFETKLCWESFSFPAEIRKVIKILFWP